MKIEVKPAQLVDAQALADVLTEATQYKLAHNDKAWGSEPYTVEEVTERISEGNTYAAWSGTTLVGTVMFLWEDEMTWGHQPPVAGYLHQAAIKDGFHGLGYGKQIFDWAADEVAAKGRTLLRLICRPDNLSLRKYYESLNFIYVKDRKIHAPDKTYTAALYERKV